VIYVAPVLPIVGITIGDVNGIGPEIVVKSLGEMDLYQKCRPLVIGDPKVIEKAIALTGSKKRLHIVRTVDESQFNTDTLDVLEVGSLRGADLSYGRVTAEAGNASVLQSKEAARLALAGEIDAITSGPVNKEAMLLAGYHYEGQTQLFGEYTGAKRWGMLLLLGSIRCYMLTNHMSLVEACEKVTKERILNALQLLDDAMSLFVPDRKPVIAVSALNPHSGENGLFGREEIEEIAPAVTQANLELKSKVVGPIPADTIFVEAQNGKFDALISLFHDQANMAMKLLGFGEVVTYVLGLPIIRTSVGHGTAFDIAGKNIANYRNLQLAIEVAADLAISKKGRD
jgi:4-hydroxythreonine-4-phosphate dehydrogenase